MKPPSNGPPNQRNNDWSEADSSLYREIASVAVPAREVQIAIVLTLLPFDRREAFRIVELGSGPGSLSHALLDCFPNNSEAWNYYRFPDPGDRPSPLVDQLAWLKEAGFAIVDCFWLQAGHAIFGGYKSVPEAVERVGLAEALQYAEEACRITR